MRSATEVVDAFSGLPLDPYFSARQARWAGSWQMAGSGCAAGVRLGTVDAFLSERLGAGYATDPSTASRTQLSGIVGGGCAGWDHRLLEIFGVPAGRAAARSWTAPVSWARSVTRAGARSCRCGRGVVDQQAALAGTGCVLPGQAKATYGTGVFVLAHTGRRHRDGSGRLGAAAHRRVAHRRTHQ